MANRFFSNYETYKITDKYGERVIFGTKSFHHGIDLVAKASDGGSRTDYITAHTGGKVVLVGYNDSIGNYIYIETAPNVQMAYFHFRDKLNFKVGDKIEKGQVLGYMGATGQVTGAHLHWAIQVNGNWIDPEPYLDKDYVVQATPTYVGYLDTATSSTITGWAWNSIDDTPLNVDVKIFKDNALVKTITTTANIYREDLLNAKKGNGKHGFIVSFDFSTLGAGTYKVNAYTNGKMLNNTKTVIVEKKITTPISPITNTNTTTYTVVKGDSYWAIAEKLGDSSRFQEIQKLNDGKALFAGDVIIVPSDMKTTSGATTPTKPPYKNYTVKSGDSFWSIAASQMGSGTKMNELASYNGLTINSVIRPGQTLKIPM